MKKITYIDEVEIKNKRILLRLDLNVSLDAKNQIANDARLQQVLPTIKHLLKHNNKIIIVSHLGRPTRERRNSKFSLSVVATRLQQYLENNQVTLVDDYKKSDDAFATQTNKEIIVLENIRFFPGEKQNNPEFSRSLAQLADIYVNDAFAVSHRTEASIVGIPTQLPSYGGILLKKEISMMDRVIKDPKKPVVVILGGSKISTKINLIDQLMKLANHLLVGGGIANTFLASQDIEVGQSIYEYGEKENARRLLYEARRKKTMIMLPVDAVCGKVGSEDNVTVKKIEDIKRSDNILDIGPETQAIWGATIANAKTIIWNGPVGYFENQAFRRGTDFIYYMITQNDSATSVVGGGDTLAAISKKEYLDKITHISTGGGAMLEYIEKGTLPGIEALKN